MKTKHDYISIYDNGVQRRFEEAERLFERGLCEDPIFEANEDFEYTATVDEIVGYYLTIYGDEAYKVWSFNIENIKKTNRHKEIDSILKQFNEEVEK